MIVFFSGMKIVVYLAKAGAGSPSDCIWMVPGTYED